MKNDLLNKLRELMKKERVDLYICDTKDPHGSEYINESYKIREFFTGFTGSNGVFLCEKDKANLWTDGRYFVQAANELNDEIGLMKMGEKNVPTVFEYIKNNIGKGDVIGFNGYLITASFYDDLNKICKEKGSVLKTDFKPEETLWTGRPEDKASETFILDDKYTGESLSSKVMRIREHLKKEKADVCFISALDDQAWLYNLRGNDIDFNPVFYGYTLISADDCLFFPKKKAINDTIKKYLADNHVFIGEYESAYDELSKYLGANKNKTCLIDKTTLNSRFYEMLSEKSTLKNVDLPTKLFKCVKNKTEIENLKDIYLKDSIKLTKFIKYIKDNAGTDLTEVSAAKVLDEMRSEIECFIELSFPTISAYGPNAAMMHYEPSEDNPVYIEKAGIYLVDSGGQYMKGTTDVTRSIVLGPLDEECRRDYTLSVCGMLRLMNAVFIKGCTGRNLDIMARSPHWAYFSDYKCGTGHGVGCCLNVHEGPVNIGWQKRRAGGEYVIEPGNVVSDEPGAYREGKYGIRIENILLCEERGSSPDGDFLGFIPLTVAPIDRAGMDINYMNSDDIRMYNDYQSLVFEKLSPMLSEDENIWLKEETKPL